MTALARDVKARCSAIIKKLTEMADGDVTTQLDRLPEVCSATVECYAGNCSYCPHRSIVCSGVGTGEWWYKSSFLNTHGITHLKMTENDKAVMLTVLEIRLSEQAVIMVADRTSTQKCESFNSAMLSTAPKHIKMSRNFTGKLASKTLQLNNSLEHCVRTKVQKIVGKGLSKVTEKQLKVASKRAASHKTQLSASIRRQRRLKNRARLEQMYHSARNVIPKQPEYQKGMLDDISLPKDGNMMQT